MTNPKDLQPGRSLDALVAEKVMGFKAINKTDDYLSGVQFFGNDDIPGVYKEVPHYSTDIAAAWLVVEKLTTTTKQWSRLEQHSTGWYWSSDFK